MKTKPSTTQVSAFDIAGFDDKTGELTPAFHNSTGIEGKELADAEASAESYRHKVKGFFAAQPLAKFAAHEVFAHLAKQNKKLLLGTVRKSMTDLKNSKHLIKTDEKVQSKYNARCFRYQWNPAHQVTTEDLQP